MYLPESPLTQAAKVALMSAARVRCNVDSCEIPFDSNNQSGNILPTQKSLSSHIGFYCFVIVTAKSEPFKQILKRDTNSSLETIKIQNIKYISLGECNQETTETELPYQRPVKFNVRLAVEAGSMQGPLVSIEGTVGCIVRKGRDWRKNIIPQGAL